MNRIHEFINEAGLFYLATVDGNQPKLRPLGAHINYNGKEYFTVGDFKNVYRQMVNNPLVEIVAYTPNDRKWLRYTGEVKFEDNEEVKEKILEELPHLRQAYSKESGRKMMIFTLENAKAKIIDMAGNEEIII